jgi:hypothetical protein
MQEPIENGDRVKIHERLACLETNVEAILENHLPHLQNGIDDLSKKFNWILVLMITNIVGLAFEIVRHATIK